MSLSIGGLNNYNNGIVSGTELERVSREIFGEAQVKVNTQSTSVAAQQAVVDPTRVNVLEKGTEIDLTRQVSQLKADFNLQISQNGLNSINALNAFAATQQVNAISKAVEGKIHVPLEIKTEAQNKDFVNIFARPTEVKNAMNLGKDRRGSSPFGYSVIAAKKASKKEAAESSQITKLISTDVKYENIQKELQDALPGQFILIA